MVSFKTATGAILTIQRQPYKIVSFRDIYNGRLIVDTSATIVGKQDMNKQGRRVIMIYKAHMYTESSLGPERRTHKSNEKARRSGIQTHLRQIDQYEDIDSPVKDQQEDDTMEEADADTRRLDRTELPPSGSGVQTHTRGTSSASAAAGTLATGVHNPSVVTHLRFGTPEPPTIPPRDGGGTHTGTNPVELQNKLAPLKQQGASSGDQGNLNLNSGILKGGSVSTASSSRGSRGRDPIPLTPEIRLLLDRLEPDKRKQARLFTEHLTEHRTLPCIEQKLQKLLERKVEKRIKRQHAAA